jgi:dienelactone hydrolase
MTVRLRQKIIHQEVTIPTVRAVIKGDLGIPQTPGALVIFAHGTGSSRLSPRNQHVAEILQQAGLATLLVDLLSEEEDQIDFFTGKLRFDIPFLAGRVDSATEWVLQNNRISKLRIGYFGASTGAAAAMVASLQRPQNIRAIVCRGGRPDLADDILSEVKAPTLLIVGSNDETVLEYNQASLKKLTCEKKLQIVKGATHLFEEAGKLDEAAEHAKRWFQQHLLH